MTRLALNAVKNAKSHLNQVETDLFTAGNAIGKRKDSDSLELYANLNFISYIFFYFSLTKIFLNLFKYKKRK